MFGGVYYDNTGIGRKPVQLGMMADIMNRYSFEGYL
jgi:hypothetical protein